MNHDDHDERRDEDCAQCQAELAEAIFEHAWMSRAVKANAVNPYGPTDENREGDPAFNGAFDRW